VLFEFERASAGNPRLVQNGSITPVGGGAGVTWNLYQYYPQNEKPAGESAPYLYFKAVANQYIGTPTTITTPMAVNTLPYVDSTVSNQPSFVNPKSFQILCPGLDGKFGTYQKDGWPKYPHGTNYTTETSDDMTSFATGSTVNDDVP
jgi:hypothetical protein